VPKALAALAATVSLPVRPAPAAVVLAEEVPLEALKPNTIAMVVVVRNAGYTTVGDIPNEMTGQR